MTSIPEQGVRSRSLYYDGLRTQIRNKVLLGQTGDRLPGDRELAKEIGTSKITVGHILQELQAEGLLERIPGKGTFLRDRQIPRPVPIVLNELAQPQQLPSAAPVPVPRASSCEAYVMILAVLNLPWEKHVPFENNWSQRFALAAERALQKQGARTMVRNRFGLEEDEIVPLVDKGIDAGINHILFIQGSLAQKSRMALFENHLVRLSLGRGQTPIPVTQISTEANLRLPFPAIAFDGESGSQIATQHLIDLGHRRIVFAGPSMTEPEAERQWIVDRVRGFRRALQLSGLEQVALLHETEETLDSPFFVRADPVSGSGQKWAEIGRTVARKVLRDETVTAVVAANDTVAAQIILAALEAGKRVPEDLSVVGFDNYQISSELDLTTVSVPIEQMSEAAANMILDPAAQSKDRKQCILLDPWLVTRGSTCPPRPS